MRDKIEPVPPPQIPQDFRGTSRPHSSYASSASSTSSYASSLSSASNASDSFKYPSSSFPHSKVSPMVEVTPDRISQYSSQYNTLRRHPSGGTSPTTPQLTTPSQSSPSSSPASSTFEGYEALPSKYATLSLGQGYGDRIHYPNPSMPSSTLGPNFRHSIVPDASHYGTSSLTRVVHGGDLNRSRTFLNADGTASNGMRGISNLGEVVPINKYHPTSTKNGRRTTGAHYASTPHLFVFQSVDDDASSDSEAEDTSQITKANTLSNRNTPYVPAANSSTTLPRITPVPTPGGKDEHIYSSTSDISKTPSVQNGSSSPQPTNGHYETPHTLTSNRRASSCSMIGQDGFAVTNEVVSRIETSFRGHKTQLWVCRTMANLYTEEGTGKEATWKLQFTGVPALMLDLGETKSRRKRQLQIIFAEKESGFELWKDVIDNLTSYKVDEPHFHTLYLSSDHRRKIGLSFNEGQAAMVFHSQLEALTSNPENISLSAPGKKKKKKPKQEKIPKYKAPRKTDISTPCNFNHVTNVGLSDKEQLYSLQVYGDKMPPPASSPVKEPLSALTNPPFGGTPATVV